MLYIAICDDCDEQRELQKQYLKNIFENKNMDYYLFEWTSGEELLEKYKKPLDILFLDIQMGELDGMQTARKIREFDQDVKIIFTTVIWDYVREGYKVNAFRYLIKPLKYEEYQKEVQVCIQEINRVRRFITLDSGIKLQRICLDDIIYIETAERRVQVHTREEVFVHYEKMSEVEEKLKEYNFYRCHTGYLINLKSIMKLDYDYVTLEGNIRLPVSKYRIKDLKIELLDLLSRVIE